MNSSLLNLIEAEKKASLLFKEIEAKKYISAGISELELNKMVFELAYEMFGIKKYWHKRIVRAGKNTLLPYRENPPNEVIQDDDILFFDFGPVFDEWEADFGRTYVIGQNEQKKKIKQDVELAWQEGKQFYLDHKSTLKGKDLYDFTQIMANRMGWEFGNSHCGHLIGSFPHEKIQGEEIRNFLHAENSEVMNTPDKYGNERFWIYEIHFIDKKLQIGGFFEQLLNQN